MIFLGVYLTVALLGLMALPSYRYYYENTRRVYRISADSRRFVKHQKLLSPQDVVVNTKVDWWDADVDGTYSSFSVGPVPTILFMGALTWPVSFPLYLLVKGIKGAHKVLQIPGKKLFQEKLDKNSQKKDNYLLEGEQEVEKLLNRG